MSVEENKAVIRRFVEEGFNQRNPALVDEVFAENYHGNTPDRPEGRTVNDIRTQITGAFLGTAFPDAQYSTEDLFGEGDRVLWRWVLRGTHTGPLMGMPATGKPVAVQGIHIFRLAGGKIVEDWVFQDSRGLMQQLGVMPPLQHGPAQS